MPWPTKSFRSLDPSLSQLKASRSRGRKETEVLTANLERLPTSKHQGCWHLSLPWSPCGLMLHRWVGIQMWSGEGRGSSDLANQKHSCSVEALPLETLNRFRFFNLLAAKFTRTARQLEQLETTSREEFYWRQKAGLAISPSASALGISITVKYLRHELWIQFACSAKFQTNTGVTHCDIHRLRNVSFGLEAFRLIECD